MRYIVTGAQGMLGSDMVLALQGRDVLALNRNELDITDASAVRTTLLEGDVVVNCAAYNAVDDAEQNEDLAMSINAYGPEALAIAAREVGATLVHISSDYVFGRETFGPHLESEVRSPLSAYGRSKALGEELVLKEHPTGSYVVRTAWLYGANGTNFAQTMLNLARSIETWPVVDDQRGQPTWTCDLAEQIVRLLDMDAPAGIYHGTNAGEATWCDFAQAVLAEAGLDPARVTPTDSSQFVRPAPRPTYSVLSHGRWNAVGVPPMRPWRDALHDAFQSGVFEI